MPIIFLFTVPENNPSYRLKEILVKAQDIWRGKNAAATALKILLSRILIIGINILTSIISARILGPAGRGEQTAMGLSAGMLATLLTVGMPRSLIYNIKRSPESKSQWFASAFLISLGLGCLAGMMTSILIPQWLHKFSPEVIGFSRWLTWISPTVVVQFTCLAALDALELFSVSNIILLLIPSTTLLMLLGFLFSQTMTPFTSAFAYVFGSIPAFLGLVIYVCRIYQPQWLHLGSTFRPLLSYGIRAYGIDLLSILSQQADQVLVVGLLSPKYVGMYVVAVSLSRMLSVFQSTIVSILFPKIAARSLGEVMLVTGQATRLTLSTMTLSSLVVAVCGPSLLTLLYSQEFQEATTVLRFLVLETLISSTTLVLAQAFMALGRPGIVTVLQAIGLALSVPLMVFLVPKMGLVGAGIALLASAIVRFGCILACFPVILKVAPPNLLITTTDLKYFCHKLLHRDP